MIKHHLGENWADLLLESLADGVFTLDHKGKITSWNRSMERISGYTAEDALGRTCLMLGFNRCMGRRCPSNVIECDIFKNGAVDGKECMLRHKSGHDVPVLKSARTLKHKDGSILGVVETVTDLTELYDARKKAESAIIRLGEMSRFDNIIGQSHGMQGVFEAIRAAAASEVTVLIQGESGTGKELIAQAIHYNSVRSGSTMVTVNCSALSEFLLESELFGHVKGAYTGAVNDRIGRFEEANGGSILLDEIAEVNPYIQVKLLRVLQEREVERVGDSRKRKIDIRIIAASNKNLLELVQKGLFREDLYYRLKVFPITVPPLRKRKEDIPLLSSHFIKKQNGKTGKNIRGLKESALRIMMDHTWPGNVRELENAIEHAFVLCSSGMIDMLDLPVEIRQTHSHPSIYKPETEKSHEEKTPMNRERLCLLLEQADWNKAEAARRIGISRTAIWKWMKKWNIPLERFSKD
ncbi:MAG: sigma 54-interacting transcriptional regulator [Proteobacteria bacterium]|nr:sigma 54-interacting transcriptional regulator [Pseudomonadota bacterium]